VREAIEGDGYYIIEVANGQEAVDQALADPPDLILMDVVMPGMDGLEATQRLKAHEQTARVPILMLTTLNNTEDRVRAFESGVTGFLSKPFDTLELLAHVRSYVNLSRINRKYVLSTADRVTGLPNVAAFREALQGCDNPYLFLIRLDHVETIMRFYGEAKATEIEREFGELLSRAKEEGQLKGSLAYRFQRGIFGILFDDTAHAFDRDTALEIANQLYQWCLEYDVVGKIAPHGTDYTVVVSAGEELLFEQGELGLSKAGAEYESVLYAPDIVERAHEEIHDNLYWLDQIRQAVGEDRFLPVFQPIYDHHSGAVERYEALARLQMPGGELISPGRFMLAAKNSKYYPELTRSMLLKVIREFRHRPEGVSINVSALDMRHASTREFVLQTLRSNPDVASRMTVEIVEQEGVDEYDRFVGFVQEIKETGAQVALDDFGSGYSNLMRVLTLQADYLKIDGSLIRDVVEDSMKASLVEFIVSFSSIAKLEVIAEFVENEDTMAWLRERGVRYSQGYYIGLPVPASELPAVSREG
jgi:EAL domain-containing protein (putative c-di-GMP-specific phosphodiesterase class I)